MFLCVCMCIYMYKKDRRNRAREIIHDRHNSSGLLKKNLLRVGSIPLNVSFISLMSSLF